MMQDRIRDVFHEHDDDGNGMLCRGELSNALKSLGVAVGLCPWPFVLTECISGLPATRQEVNDILEEMDGAGSGLIMAVHESVAHKQVTEGEKDGMISFAEFATVINGWMREVPL